MFQHLIQLACLAGALANVYDVVMPAYRPSCINGCLSWTDAAQFLPKSANLTQTDINAMFVDTNGSADAQEHCAMPGARAGTHEKDCGLHCHSDTDQWSYLYDSYAGPWCFCKDPVIGVENSSQYCTPPLNTPEQINLQYASPTAVVVGFVTYEPPNSTTAPPQARLFLNGDMKVVTGVTHKYSPPGRNSTSTLANATEFALPYMMHYITLPVTGGLQYNYSVRSGSSDGLWSPAYSFRAPGGRVAETRIATYGDMGHSHFNCMQNVKDDVANGLIDLVVHMGDHCYNLGMANDRRGDAYMNAWQPALTTLPWFPIIGNHEWIYKNLKPGESRGGGDGDSGRHYEAIAWGEAYGVSGDTIPFPGPGALPPPPPPPSHSLGSTATTALGHHLATGTFYGMGSQGPIPSNTSAYVSADIGLIHMVGLDLNNLDPAQLVWLEADLARANQNRSNTPWIMVMSHFPLIHTETSANANMSAAHYIGDELMGEYAVDGRDMKFEACPVRGKSCQTVGEFQQGIGQALQPLFRQYGVDVYNAGHVHSYENTWPLCDFNGSLCRDSNGTELKTMNEPRGTVHITEGNGGVPGVPATFGANPCKRGSFEGCRMVGNGGAYGRITATPTMFTYNRIANNGGTVTDSWTITQHNHGPFPLA